MAEAGGKRETMADLRLALERRIGAYRERSLHASASFRRHLNSARSFAQDYLHSLEKLDELKGNLRELQADLVEALTVKTCKDSRYKSLTESLSTKTAQNEQKTNILAEQRAKKDEFSALISDNLAALEELEAKIKEDQLEKSNLESAIMWYQKVLGFRAVGGEGVKFFFDKIDLRNPDKEYSFTVKLENDKYRLLQCEPNLKGTDELIKELNRTNDLFHFVRVMRHKFHSALSNGAVSRSSSMVTMPSSPVPTSLDSKSDNSSTSRTSLPSHLRRSPRFSGRGLS